MTYPPTPEQLDGIACIGCGTDLTPPDVTSYPARTRRTGQVFACARCTARCHDSELADHRCPVCAGDYTC
ncbi:hypothetical protein [Actinomadura rupiterrae]|uniref:hypothetical protein n=1 Tax=Actinomadura rupiterrae TaxID=559627 RepID=UPI0020A3BAC2|nr:hypothetical protein [Actinomadura rupiterrae]MCP2341018.1 hypothetical protein [Actinomadura rupiterrae]